MDHNTIMCHSLVVEAQAIVAEIDAMRCANIARAIEKRPMAYNEDEFRALVWQLRNISVQLHERANQ